ncbi:MAG: alpha-galactosidase, partial [Oscillospiraceae bacterium]|nr:alpha-galactosidase [Oscillospiraceae bacterium]
AMLLRIHQSGHLANLSPERFALVQEGISCYKGIRQNLKTAVPFWPLGLSSYGDEWVSLGLKSGPKTYVALWRRGSASPVCTLPVKHLLGRQAEARCLYPARGDCSFRWNPEAGSLTAELPHPMSARLFELTTGD